MRQEKNKYGLKRRIDRHIAREIRRRSKNGCVICRCGIFTYEHIDPVWVDARTHDPERICLLCGGCHLKVTKGLCSKETVLRNYREIQAYPNVHEPREFFDFVGPNVRMLFGGLVAQHSPTKLFVVDKDVVFGLVPETPSSPAGINARFSDDNGKQLFQISGNEWIGPSNYFDLETVGSRFTVRLPNGQEALRLRYESPDIIALERLDMRFREWHLLCSEHDIALGRRIATSGDFVWMHIKARIESLINESACIRCTSRPFDKDFNTSREPLFPPKITFSQNGKDQLTTVAGWGNKLASALGISWPAVGISFLQGTSFGFTSLSVGVCSIEHARKHFFRKNRVNAPSLLLPAVLNKQTLAAAELQLEEARLQSAKPGSTVPFLAKEDKSALAAWESRAISRLQKGDSIRDEKPGMRHAWGILKLNDAYDGPAVRVARL